jgi:hypothetical protein
MMMMMMMMMKRQREGERERTPSIEPRQSRQSHVPDSRPPYDGSQGSIHPASQRKAFPLWGTSRQLDRHTHTCTHTHTTAGRRVGKHPRAETTRPWEIARPGRLRRDRQMCDGTVGCAA